MADPTDETPPTDAQIAQEIASSPTAQGAGPTPDEIRQPVGQFAQQVAPAPATGPVTSPAASEQPVVDTSPLGVVSASFKGARDQEKAPLGVFNPQIPLQLAKSESDSLTPDIAAQRAANTEVAATTQRHEAQRQLLLNAQAESEKKWAEDERTAAETAKHVQAQYLANYETQLAGVRQMAVDPTGPIGRMTGGQFAGMSLAMFAQGFLAARGIHIDVSGQIDKWVDRDIAEQQRRIQSAQQGAEDQLHLYQIARQTAADDAEARQKYRGMIIAATQTSLQVAASQYQSDLANAQAGVANAQLQTELDKTKAAIAGTAYDRMYRAGVEVANIKHQERQDSIAFAHLALEKQKLALQMAQPDISGLYIPDPEPVTDAQGNQVKDSHGNPVLVNRWRVNPNLPKELQNDVFKKADEAQVKYNNYKTATDTMMSSYRAAKAFRDAHPVEAKAGWDALARIDGSGVVQQFLQDRSQWVLAKVYNDSGKQINESEFDRESALAYLDKTLARNGNKTEMSMAQLSRNGRQAFDHVMNSMGIERVDERDPNYLRRSQPSSPISSAQDTATLTGGAPVNEWTSAEVKATEIGSPREVGQFEPSSALHLKLTGEKVQPHQSIGVEHLARVFADPSLAQKMDPGAPSDDKLVKDQALAALIRIADGGRDPETNQTVIPAVADYANKIVNLIKSDPQALNKYFVIGGEYRAR